MSDSSAVRVPRLERRRATGYEIGRRVRRVEERDMITTGAASVYSTPADMARYLAALLGGGANRHGSVLEPETLATMFDAHYQPDPRVPGMGLSFFRYFINGALVVGHQGSHPGFHSQLFAAPHDGVGVLGFTNGAYQPDMWLPAELANLLARRLGSSTERGSAPHRPDIWEGLCGTYRLNAAATDVRLRAMVGLGAQVFVAGGRLMLRFLTPIPDLYRGFELRAVPGTDPYLFEADVGDDMVQMHAAFCQTAGSTDRVVIDLMPLVLYKRTRRSRRRSERTMAEGS